MKTVAPAYQDRLFHLINTSQFPAHMKMRITEIGWGTSTFEMTAEEFRIQPFGVVHGGNLATLIDSATFWACYLALETDDDGLTSVDLTTHYIAAARKNKMIGRGKMLKAGKSLFYAEASATDEDGRLLAHGTSTLMRMKGLGLKLNTPMFCD